MVIGVTIYNNKRNRRIHLADKRKEWLVEFRSKVAELTAMLTMGRFDETVLRNKIESLDNDKNAESDLKTMDEVEAFNNKTSRRLTLINEIMLLSFEDGDDIVSATNMGDLLRQVSEMQSFGEDSSTGQLARNIMTAANNIIIAKWEKIKGLKG